MNSDLVRKPTLRKVGRINGPSDFDKLVAGFKKMRCVTYVAKTEDILRLFDLGLESLDLVLGYQLDDSGEDAIRSGMKQNVTSLDRLLSLYQANRFVALLPKRPIVPDEATAGAYQRSKTGKEKDRLVLLVMGRDDRPLLA